LELTRGYKTTEVGILPQEWEVKSVREFSHIRTGPFGTLLKANEYSDTEGVPLVSVGEVGNGRLNVTEHTPLVPAAVVRRLPQYLLRTGDIVFGRKGAVERSALVTERENGWFLGSDGIGVRPQAGCFPLYLAWQFQRYQVQAWLLQHAIGTTMPSLNQSILGRVRIPYAPIPEQRAIASALSDVDALVVALTRLISKKRDLRHAAAQQLLTGRTRLPGFTADWKQRRVSEMGEVLAGKALAARGVGALRPYLRTKNVLDGRIDLNDVLQMPMTDAEFKTFRVEGGDVLLNEGQSIGLVGRCAMYRGELGSPCAMQNQLLRFRARPGASAAFAEHLFRHSQQIGAFAAIATQTTSVAHLGGVRFSNLRLLWPIDLDEQAAIASVLFDMDAELTALEARRDKTRALKQAMMQELLTGKTRLV
jgi:type I restriction enzyme S subunit